MYTECPHCHAIFRVTQAILQAAGGKVRCGECSNVFQAVKPRHQEPKKHPEAVYSKSNPKAPTNHRQPLRTQTRPPSDDTSVKHKAQVSSTQRPPIFEEPKFSLAADSVPADPDALPKYLPIPTEAPQPRIPRRFRGLMPPLAIGLIVLLLAQVIVGNRKTLIAQPMFRPIISALCKVSGCEVPRHQDIRAIELLNHGVYSHPTVPNALMIKALIVSRADFDQPHPVIELGFSNIRGKHIAVRRFGPQEYLDPNMQHKPLMTSNKPAPVRLEVVDPGKQALAFEFKFL